VHPLVGFALAHAEQASLHDLERIGLQVDQNEEQPIFRRRQGAVLILKCFLKSFAEPPKF
jgi:hypothetical protein